MPLCSWLSRVIHSLRGGDAHANISSGEFTKDAPFDERFKAVMPTVEARKLYAIGLEPQDIIEVPLNRLYIQFRSEWPIHGETGNPRSKQGLKVTESPLVTFIDSYKNSGNSLFTSGDFKKTDYFRMWKRIDSVGWRYNWYDYPAKLVKQYPDDVIEKKMRSVAKVYDSICNVGYKQGDFAKTIITALDQPFENGRFGTEHKIDGYEIWSGHHRCAVLHVLGHKKAEVILLKDIKKNTGNKMGGAA